MEPDGILYGSIRSHRKLSTARIRISHVSPLLRVQGPVTKTTHLFKNDDPFPAALVCVPEGTTTGFSAPASGSSEVFTPKNVNPRKDLYQ
jgi:hypothetical protein